MTSNEIEQQAVKRFVGLLQQENLFSPISLGYISEE